MFCYCSFGCKNAPHCHIIRTLPFVNIDPLVWPFTLCTVFFQWNHLSANLNTYNKNCNWKIKCFDAKITIESRTYFTRYIIYTYIYISFVLKFTLYHLPTVFLYFDYIKTFVWCAPWQWPQKTAETCKIYFYIWNTAKRCK